MCIHYEEHRDLEKLSAPNIQLMKQNISHTQPSRKGFTLIELLVVIAIIASLAGIGYGVFINVFSSAKQKETKTRLLAIAEAMEARAAKITSQQRLALENSGVTFVGKFPAHDSNFSTAGLAQFLSGDFDGSGQLGDENDGTTMAAEYDPGQASTAEVVTAKSWLQKDGQKVVIVDAWQRELRYESPGQRNSHEDGFDLWSAGEDGKFETEEDNIYVN